MIDVNVRFNRNHTAISRMETCEGKKLQFFSLLEEECVIVSQQHADRTGMNNHVSGGMHRFFLHIQPDGFVTYNRAPCTFDSIKRTLAVLRRAQ